MNTSLRVSWEIMFEISRCSDVYSIPAYDFRIRAEVGMINLPELETVSGFTIINKVLVLSLKPHPPSLLVYYEANSFVVVVVVVLIENPLTTSHFPKPDTSYYLWHYCWCS